MDSFKLVLITASLILVTGTVSAIDINSSQKLNYYNDGNLEFSVDTNGAITAKGSLNMNSNQISGANIDSTSQVDDGAIPDVETLSFSSRFAGNQIPWSSVDQDLNLNGQNIQNINQLEGFFQSACPSGEALVDVTDSGNFVCTNVTSEVSGAYVNRNGDSMTGNLDMNSNGLLNVGSLTGSNIVNSDNIASDAVNSNELNETDSYGLDWNNLALSRSDVSKGDVGLGNVENIALSTATWSDLGISQSDISKSDVGLGSVENVALSTAGWSDIGISQSDVLSTANDLDSNGNLQSNSVGQNELNQSNIDCSGAYC